MSESENVTLLLDRASRGDRDAANELFHLVEQDLKKIAGKRKRLARFRLGHGKCNPRVVPGIDQGCGVINVRTGSFDQNTSACGRAFSARRRFARPLILAR